ncbi:hypothetical protein BHECKSOX_1371 [Bathymodiolus heckerae thiotrophic gill symbiont]|nr:hypothetical protein BHECKSOX_1371 [Bathymodiolus heckerae thiotrophic gill symbiont]
MSTAIELLLYIKDEVSKAIGKIFTLFALLMLFVEK